MEFYDDEPSEIDHQVDPCPFDLPNLYKIYVSSDKSKSKLINTALKHFGPDNPILWSADGRFTSIAVTCAEIMKAKCKFKTVYQNTQISEMRTIETWTPLQENNGLDPLRVVRAVPIIHILISVEPLDENAIGFQKWARSSGSRQKRNVYKSSFIPRTSEASQPIPIPLSSVAPSMLSSSI